MCMRKERNYNTRRPRVKGCLARDRFLPLEVITALFEPIRNREKAKRHLKSFCHHLGRTPEPHAGHAVPSFLLTCDEQEALSPPL